MRYSEEYKRTERFGNRACFRPQVRGHHLFWVSYKQLTSVVGPITSSFVYLEYRTMDKVQKPSKPECYTLPPERLRICVWNGYW
jgi:hypothetical protein